MNGLFHFDDAVERHPDVEDWLTEHSDELGLLARRWYEVLRACGDDVRETLHDRQPTACVTDCAFAYVDAFKAHVNVGFFRGAELSDPSGLLEGTGKYMRHVKLRLGVEIDEPGLTKLIRTAYDDMKRRLRASDPSQ